MGTGSLVSLLVVVASVNENTARESWIVCLKHIGKLFYQFIAFFFILDGHITDKVIKNLSG
jgi:hypothetical protein